MFNVYREGYVEKEYCSYRREGVWKVGGESISEGRVLDGRWFGFFVVRVVGGRKDRRKMLCELVGILLVGLGIEFEV